MSISVPTYGPVNRSLVRHLESVPPEQDGPFFMLNLMRYRPAATYEDGRETTLTGMQADDLYAPVDILADLGAEIVLFGDVEAQQRGDEAWERVAIVRYPTIRSFLDMQQRPDFLERHVHKDAGMQSTVIAVCTPLAGGLAAAPAPLLVDLVAGVQPEVIVPAPGEALLRVDGTLVGERTDYSVLRLRPLDHAAAEAEAVLPTDGAATTVTMGPLLNALPAWLPADAIV